jgi:hypothetical protein
MMATRAEKKKDPAAVALGRKGGQKGGPARAAKLTPKERSESARKAVQARWAKAKTKTAPSTMMGYIRRSCPEPSEPNQGDERPRMSFAKFRICWNK